VVIEHQKTIGKEVMLRGPGLFSGQEAELIFQPAEPDTGITFIREQEGRKAAIPAVVQHVMNRPRRTCLHNGSLHVETVEHCMAALAGMGIDNAQVVVRGGETGELPMGDGSAKPFVQAIQDAGIVEQESPLQSLVIRRPIHLSDGKASIAALPGPLDRLEIIYDFEAPFPIGHQLFAFHVGEDDFVNELAPARTFIFENEAHELRARGMGLHLTPKDLLVLSERGPIDNRYRFTDECARHKTLDLLGDLYLAGRPLRGRIVAHRSGHSLNHQLVRKLLEQETVQDRQLLLNRDAVMDIRKIMRVLPHRYPMLMVDRVLEMQGDQKATGIKNVTFNDVFFQGHYPGTPIMPGVLIVEAMSQLGGLLLSQKLDNTGKLPVLLSMDKVKWRHPVVPGDQLILEAVTVRVKARTGHVRCKAYVHDKMAAEADLKFMLVDAEPPQND
jgi:UDP-3-O-[3-hydroxymyristoyl] N-acetylglucosamine deacetylase / 3-hydroxyacyl-[acyl-carrier-protein] dehydratase